MSAQKYSISGRPRPTGSQLDLYVWWAVRISSLALFVLALAHFSMTHFVFDPADQSAEWVRQTRWSSVALRALDWGMLMAVLVHGFLGMRTVLQDYVPSRVRSLALGALYALALILFALGTQVVVTLPMD
jgi:succinate dehydrogenase / fumarate reductase membrane anchor subunit